jgi:hypothetical protein
VTVADDEAHSGNNSLKSDDPSGDQNRLQRSLSSLPTAIQSTHWGRIFYKNMTPVPVNKGGVTHVTYTSLTGSKGEVRIVDTVENSSTPSMHQWLYNLPSDGCSQGSAYNWGYDDAWHCAEWYIDATTDTYRFYADSVEVTSISFANMTCASMSVPFTDIILGTTSYQTPNGPWIMWEDDLAISSTQIGCGPTTY